MSKVQHKTAETVFTDRQIGLHIALQLANGLPMWCDLRVHLQGINTTSTNYLTLEFLTVDAATAWARRLKAAGSTPFRYESTGRTEHKWNVRDFHGWDISILAIVVDPEPTPVDTEAVAALTAALAATGGA